MVIFTNQEPVQADRDRIQLEILNNTRPDVRFSRSDPTGLGLAGGGYIDP